MRKTLIERVIFLSLLVKEKILLYYRLCSL